MACAHSRDTRPDAIALPFPSGAVLDTPPANPYPRAPGAPAPPSGRRDGRVNEDQSPHTGPPMERS